MLIVFLLYIETADWHGLLMEIIKIMADINISVESAEIDTEGLVAKDKFHVSYRGAALNSSLSQKSVFVVGMVCCNGEGHLNEKSILLQGSVEHSGGQRVRLDLQKLNRFSLFLGQVQQQVIEIITHIASTVQKFPKKMCGALHSRRITWSAFFKEKMGVIHGCLEEKEIVFEKLLQEDRERIKMSNTILEAKKSANSSSEIDQLLSYK